MSKNVVASHASEKKVFVTQQTPDGFCVYEPSDPHTLYLVQGIPEKPSCSCGEFQANRNNPSFRCEHITAVYGQRASGAQSNAVHQGSGNNKSGNENGFATPIVYTDEDLSVPHPQMQIKRSVSPDGRIDSLSVEFHCPVDLDDAEDVIQQAQQSLHLQAQIMESFRREQPAQQPQSVNHGHGNNYSNGTIVQLTHIAGRQTKYGWRMYINVRINGQNALLFGTKQKLGEYLNDAGYPEMARDIREGNQLNVQCQAILKQNNNDRYPTIEKLFPLNGTVQLMEVES